MGPAAVPRFSQRFHFRLRILALSRREMRSFLREFSRAAGPAVAERNGESEWLADEPTFWERLTGALSLDLEDSSELTVLEELVGNVGPQGYLELTPEEIALRAGVDGAAVEAVRKRLMDYEGRGIGAADFREYFFFQCRQSNGVLSLATALLRSERRARALPSALRLLRRRLPSGPFAEILSRLADGRLRSHPATEGLWECGRFSWGAPDLIFCRKNGDWSVRALPEQDGDRPEPLRMALSMRRDMLLRIGEFLLAEQRPFLEGGPLAIRPLRQKDGADRLGLTPSTFSRAIKGKCVRMPHGLYRLGDLFCRSRESSPVLLGHCLGEIFRDDPAALLRPDRETADLLLRRYGINISTRTTREKICRFFGRRAPV
jgi:DNA-directed RNA polymerase specialized sigma54-like protein